MNLRIIFRKYGFAKSPSTNAITNKAQILFSINSFINILTDYLQKVE